MCDCGCGLEIVSVPNDEFARTMDKLRRPEDLVWLEREIDAAAHGDAAAALDAYDQGLHMLESIVRPTLDRLAQLGDETPEWLMARWARWTAYRWMLLNKDPRTDGAARLVLMTHELPDDITPEWLYEHGTRTMGCDLLCEEFALHADGGFADFIDVKAGEELLARAGLVREWPNQSLGVFEYLGVDRNILHVREIGTGERSDVLHLGAITGRDPNAMGFGRLVPILTEPGWMFEQRPISLDPETARQMSEELDDGSMGGILGILAMAYDAGRMPSRPGTREGTYLWSDVLIVDERFEEYAAAHPEICAPRRPSPREARLLERGVERAVAVALATCEYALELAAIDPSALPIAASHAATNLSIPTILDAAREHLTPPGFGPAWMAVGACLAEPLRSRCTELAAEADRKSIATAT